LFLIWYGSSLVGELAGNTKTSQVKNQSQKNQDDYIDEIDEDAGIALVLKCIEYMCQKGN